MRKLLRNLHLACALSLLTCAGTASAEFKFRDGECTDGARTGRAAGLLGECGDVSTRLIEKSRLDGAKLDGIDMSDATLRASNWKNVSLRGMRGGKLLVARVTWSHTDATGADFRGARFGNVDCDACDFRGADLRAVRMVGGRFRADFRGADLRESFIENVVFIGSDFRGAKLGGKFWALNRFEDCKFDAD